MDGNRCRLADSQKSRHDLVRVALHGGHHLAMIVGGDPTHVVVDSGDDGDGLAPKIDACENLGAFGDAGQAFSQDIRVEMVKMQVDVILVGPHTAPFIDLDGHGAGDDIARGKILCMGRIALHEAFAFRVRQVPAFAARALGNEHARAIYAGGVKLNEFHVLQRQPGAQHHGIAIAGAGVGGGAGEIGAAITACRQHSLVRLEAVHGAVFHVEGDDAPAHTIFIHDEIYGEILDKEFS